MSHTPTGKSTKQLHAQTLQDKINRKELEILLDNVTAHIHGVMKDDTCDFMHDITKSKIETAVYEWGKLNQHTQITHFNKESISSLTDYVADHWYQTHFSQFNKSTPRKVSIPKHVGAGSGLCALIGFGCDLLLGGNGIIGSATGGVVGGAAGGVVAYLTRTKPIVRRNINELRNETIAELLSYNIRGIAMPKVVMPASYQSPLLNQESQFPQERDRILHNMKYKREPSGPKRAARPRNIYTPVDMPVIR